MHKMVVQSLGWEDPLEKEMVIHPSILTWKIPWTEEADGRRSIGCKKRKIVLSYKIGKSLLKRYLSKRDKEIN